MAGGSNNPSTSKTSQKCDAKQFIVSCAICSQNMSLDDVSALRCGHIFHFMCIMYFFLYGWSSCPECHQPSEMADIMSQIQVDGNSDNKSEAARKLENYRVVLRKLHKAYTDNMALEKKELESTVEKLKLKEENYELKRKYLELVRENKALKDMLMMKP